MGKFIDLTGSKFGRLTVLRRAENKNKAVMWLCKCDCGKEIIVKAYSLRSSTTKSCGCYNNEMRIITATKHNGSLEPLYRVHHSIKQRVSNPNIKSYKNYGGRGINICAEWLDYSKFRSWALSHGYAEHLTIDRIDVNGNYEPSNCRWITNKEQQFNKRNNINITYNGITKTLTEWAIDLNIKRNTLDNRITRGWEIEDALTRSVQKHKNK